LTNGLESKVRKALG